MSKVDLVTEINEELSTESTGTAISRFLQRRSNTRSASVIPFCDGALQRSLQECKVENNLIKLHALKKSSKSALFKKKCDALLTILETLLIPSDYKTNSDVITSGQRVKGFMHFQDALDIYIDTLGLQSEGFYSRESDLKARLRDALLNREHGIRCILYKHPSGTQYIILDSDEVDLVLFLQDITVKEKTFERDLSNEFLPILSYNFAQNVLRYMDSEYDRTVFNPISPGGGRIPPPVRLSLITPKRHKVSK